MTGLVGSRRTLLLIAVVVLALAAGAIAAERDARERYEELKTLPTRATSVEDIDATALKLVEALGSVPTGDEGHEVCPLERLRVSWEEPVGYAHGTHVGEVGPPPTEDTRDVTGVVVCDGSTYAYVGFEAVRQEDGSWLLSAVPSFPEGPDLIDGAEADPFGLEEPAEDLDLGELSALDLGPIDPYAPYEPQRLCHPTPKPGASALGRLLIEFYPGTRNLGISRDCDLGPVSEHKEGRAFDWGARVASVTERAAVEDFIRRLMATDDDGNRHALARRAGIMYLIWDGQIWSSHRADEGWRPYNGPSAHTDHVHLSLSWDGAMGETSLWREALPTGWWAAFPNLELSPPTGEVPTGPPAESLSPQREAWFFRSATDDGRSSSSSDGDDGTSSDGGSDGGTDQDDSGSSDPLDTTTDTVEDTTDTVTDTTQDTIDTSEDTVDDTTDTVTDPIEDPTLDPLETELGTTLP